MFATLGHLVEAKWIKSISGTRVEPGADTRELLENLQILGPRVGPAGSVYSLPETVPDLNAVVVGRCLSWPLLPGAEPLLSDGSPLTRVQAGNLDVTLSETSSYAGYRIRELLSSPTVERLDEVQAPVLVQDELLDETWEEDLNQELHNGSAGHTDQQDAAEKVGVDGQGDGPVTSSGGGTTRSGKPYTAIPRL